MATNTKIPRHTFAGVEFAGRVGWEGMITVPRPALRKIAASGRVACTRAYSFTDDYAHDHANNNGKQEGVDPTVASRFADECPKTVSIWIREGVLHVSASWRSYELRETPATKAA